MDEINEASNALMERQSNIVTAWCNDQAERDDQSFITMSDGKSYISTDALRGLTGVLTGVSFQALLQGQTEIALATWSVGMVTLGAYAEGGEDNVKVVVKQINEIDPLG